MEDNSFKALEADSQQIEVLAASLSQQAEAHGIDVVRVANNLLFQYRKETAFLSLSPLRLLSASGMPKVQKAGGGFSASEFTYPELSELQDYQGTILAFATPNVVFVPEPESQKRSKIAAWALELINQSKQAFLILSVEAGQIRVLSELSAELSAYLGGRAAWNILCSIFPVIQSHQYDVPQTVLLVKDDNLPSLCQRFQQAYPEQWFYKPVQIEIELTHKCTLRCPECSILEDIDRALHGLEVETVNKFLTEASELGVFSYSLTGGEPFTRFQDICRIIAENPRLDCHKIQTNGTYFSSVEKASKLLQGLQAAGMGRNNRFINSSLRYSTGIQGYQNNSNAEPNLINLIEAYDNLKPNNFDLALACTLVSVDPLQQVQDLRRQMLSAVACEDTLNGIQLHAIEVHANNDLYSIHQQRESQKLSHVLSRSAEKWDCIDNARSVTPWPKLLLRANGLVYACSCFGHVFCLGSIYKNSFRELVQVANEHPLFSIINKHGIMGFLEHAETVAPGIGDRLIPNTSTRCQVCRILKETVQEHGQIG